MQAYTMEIDEKVWNYLKSKAEPFEDTPNSVLNRILFGGQVSHSIKPSVNDLPSFPEGIPKALAQILEVIYEVKKMGRTRHKATRLVAQRKNITTQAVIDKYTRQLGRKAYEIDRLLEDGNVEEFKVLLEKRFVHHRELLTSFFASLK